MSNLDINRQKKRLNASLHSAAFAGLPVVVAGFDHQVVHYRQTIFGYSEGLSPDAELWAYMELQAESTESAALRASLGRLLTV